MPAPVVLPLRVALDLRRTVGSMRASLRDPAMRFDGDHLHWAFHTADGPAALAIEHRGDHVRAQGWGPGAERALARLPQRLGLDDDLESFRPDAPSLRQLVRRFPGARLARTEGVASLLVPVVLGQLVTGREAGQAYANLMRDYSDIAPGPLELRLPLSGVRLTELSRSQYIAAGALGKQGDTLRRVGRYRRKLEEVTEMSAADAAARLQLIPGIGPWSAGSVMLGGLGFADAVPVGDFHLPNVVAWALAGEPRADDARMLELLAPYAGHRGRVVRLLMMAGVHAPKRGPRHRIRGMDTR